jgi:hypothetical protein
MTMSKYYFNVRRAHLSLLDSKGEECANLADALECAIVAVLNRITKDSGVQNWAKWSMEIKNAAGDRLATLPFTLVLNSPLCRGEQH